MSRLLQKLRRSLTARLLVVFLVTSAFLLMSLGFLVAQGLASQWRANARPHLEQYLDFISAEIGNPPSSKNARELANRLPINIYIVGPDGTYSTNGEKLSVDEQTFNRSGRRSLRKRPFSKANLAFSGDEDRTLLRSTVGEYLVYYELAHKHHQHQKRFFFIPALLSVLVVLSICFLIIRRMLRPVRDISDGVKLMGEGDLAHRVPVRHHNDLGELAESINTMAADIEQMLDAKRQLLLGASHELRSPLTRAKVAIQLMDESKASRLIEEDLNEMEGLIADILESERMNIGHATLQRSVFNPVELVRSVIDELQSSNVQLETTDSQIKLNADETRFRILLRNIIGNAITHNNNDDAFVSVKLEQVQERLLIDVVDRGQGIAAEHIEKVTEAFYRTDASRNRSTGGFGLGLHLAKLIAEAHGGQLFIRSRTTDTIHEHSGTTVIVEFPSNII